MFGITGKEKGENNEKKHLEEKAKGKVFLEIRSRTKKRGRKWIKGNFDAIKMGRENRKHVSYPYEKMPGSKYLLPSIS
ncbi:hypothetical protein D7X25_34020 [bacterium 1XD42-8]|nr:hypothetical protein [Lachnospiraceae bacterium]RKJ33624.1 hypothetical protein D7X25_34020 [bacterium 1XD42-8]